MTTPNRLAAATSPRFQSGLERAGLVFDAAQRAAIARLSEPPDHGFYLWGYVGRGKSMLSDFYYDAIPTSQKRRFHFHSFFRDLQADRSKTHGPVEASISEVVGRARAVLFDEFHVHDVADAVYLTKALGSLVDRGVLVLLTSNYAPADLMPDPLFHDRFVSAIRLIETRLEIIELGPGPDHRRTESDRGHARFRGGRWTVDVARPPVASQDRVDLTVNGLVVQAVAVDDVTATFTFADLCERPVGYREYLSLAERFDRLRLVAVPDLAEARREPLARLCILVEVLYDRDQRLDVCARDVPERMLAATAPPADAARALSRLAAMSSTVARRER